jgi:glyoxylase I family protein
MPIQHVLAVVPVSDVDRARSWYELLIGRPEDNHPMESLVEWRVTDRGVRISSIVDPDGNRITFIGGFRIVY